ncbi:MAG: BamA/TamA family outer membrane protein [Prevotella sp.]|nr:BamA/TamA family outer membrane protein [Prevotella sp.]
MKCVLRCLWSIALCAVSWILSGCSATKFVDDGEYMLTKTSIISTSKDVNAGSLQPYIRQSANSKWFSLLKIPLGVYSLAGTDTTKRINRFLQGVGEAPVIYDARLAQLTTLDLTTAMRNRGFLQAHTDIQTQVKGKKVKVDYILHPGEPYFIHSVKRDIPDANILHLLEAEEATSPEGATLEEGGQFSVDRLDQERKRITSLLTSNGYYHFHKEFIQYSADTTRQGHGVDVTLHVRPYRANNDSPPTSHPQYWVRRVDFTSGDGEKIHLRRKVLENNTAIQGGKLFSSADLQKTYNNFARLQAVKYTNIRFREIPDSNQLDCDIQVTLNKPSTLSFQPEGTNTAGDLGAAASLTYENRNLFHGSEVLSVQLRAAFEAITKLEGYQNANFEEYSVETKLLFPRFLVPFLSKDFRRRSTASTELSLAYDLQNRPEFHRRVFSLAWRYRWSDPQRHLNYRVDLPDLSYVYMPWISGTFKHDYLDSMSNRNAILRYNYEDLFIMKAGFSVTYNDGKHALRSSIETSGNFLNGASYLLGQGRNSKGQYTLFNIAYAQYVKFDFDYTRLVAFDQNNQLAIHGGVGIAYPYGNSTILPFEKRYFSGGANSVRGWSVRGLGPGKFRGSHGVIDFINQTGDVKLDLNLEYRTKLFWKINGAAFIDAGNIWTLRNYADQPGGQFKVDEFYKQIAVAYGLGFRLNFDYFILRFDMGMKAINPAYENEHEHWAVVHPVLSRDFSFHFAVGLPF